MDINCTVESFLSATGVRWTPVADGTLLARDPIGHSSVSGRLRRRADVGVWVCEVLHGGYSTMVFSPHTNWDDTLAWASALVRSYAAYEFQAEVWEPIWGPRPRGR